MQIMKDDSIDLEGKFVIFLITKLNLENVFNKIYAIALIEQ